MRASELARLIGGQLIGEDVEVERIAPPEDAGENDVVVITDEKKLKILRDRAVLCLVAKKVPDDVRVRCAIKVEDPGAAFLKLLHIFDTHPEYTEAGVHQLAFVHEDASVHSSAVIRPFAFVEKGARIGKNTVIHPFAYIGENAVVGDDCIVHPFVFIGHNVKVGNRVILHAGVKIGADGFGFRRTDEGYEKIPQIGGVVIEDDVELGANTCVDRATIGDTVIRKGTKIDNLVQVGHNVKIGRNVVIAGNSGVAGSSVVEDDVVVAGFVGIADHLRIGQGAVITAKTGVHKNLDPGRTYAGFYATEHIKFLKAYSLMLKLPDILNRIKQLEQKVAELQKQLESEK